MLTNNKGYKKMKKMTTFTYFEKKVSIDCLDKGLFKIWILDNFGNRDYEPLYTVRDARVKKYPHLIDAFCDNWVAKNFR